MHHIDPAGNPPQKRQIGNKAEDSPKKRNVPNPQRLIRTIGPYKLNPDAFRPKQLNQLFTLIRHSA
jgi:hypothetical protein